MKDRIKTFMASLVMMLVIGIITLVVTLSALVKAPIVKLKNLFTKEP